MLNYINKSFQEILVFVRKRNPKVKEIDKDTLLILESEFNKARSDFFTWIVIFKLVLMFVAVIISISLILSHTSSDFWVKAKTVQVYSYIISEGPKDFESVAAILGFFLFFTWLTTTDIFERVGFLRELSRDEMEEGTDKYLNRRFLPLNLFVLLVTLALLLILTILILLHFPYEYLYSFLSKLVRIIAIIPILIIITVYSFVFGAITLRIFVRKLRFGPKTTTINTITVRLILLACILEKITEFYLNQYDNRNMLIDMIIDISNHIKKLYNKIGTGHGISQWSIGEMEKAANSFTSLAALVYFPGDKTLETLRGRVANYVNIFASGKLHNLPKEVDDELKNIDLVSIRKGTLRKVISHLSFGLLLFGPVICIGVISIFIPDSTLSLSDPIVVFSYAVWTIVILSYYWENLKPDFRELVTTVLKSFIK